MWGLDPLVSPLGGIAMAEAAMIGARLTYLRDALKIFPGNAITASAFPSKERKGCRSEVGYVPRLPANWNSTFLRISRRLTPWRDGGFGWLRRNGGLAAAVVAAIFATATLGCSPSALKAESCRYEAERNATLAVEDAARVRIVADAGTLKISGHSDLSEIRVRGRACASDQDILEQIQLETRRSGDEISVEAKVPSDSRKFSVRGFSIKRSHGSRYLDLEIDVPDSLVLDIGDGSGSVMIQDTGTLSLKDGSGSIKIENAAGDVSIRDGSGNVDIRRVQGDVDVRDGSGSISIHEIVGSARIQDGSGGITVARVARDVTVAGDSSGSISVSQVGGDFTVEDDGSGSVHYEDVGGQVSIPD